MTLEEFNASSYYVQSTMVQAHGSFLLKNNNGAVSRMLYQVDGFYVELPGAKMASRMGIIKCFSVLEIDEYLSLIDISAITSFLNGGTATK